MNNINYLVGIDPGTFTGMAIWDIKNKKLIGVRTVMIHIAIEIISKIPNHEIKVYCENPNTFIPFKNVSQKEINSRKQGAGSIKRDFAIWQDYCEDKGIEFVATKLQGGLKKLSHEYFLKLTGYKMPKLINKNQHGYDAAMLVFGKNH